MKKGFTLIEMMVAVSIFAIAMLVGVGALLSLIEANKRAQAINAVMQNVNAAVEAMSRSIRTGTTYHCENSLDPIYPITTALNCSNEPGGIYLAFEPTGGDTGDLGDQVVYRLNGTRIERSIEAGATGTWVAITAPEVTIDPDLSRFYVVGADLGDSLQPRVLILIHGSAVVPGGTTDFTIQSLVTQRLIDVGP